MKTNTKKVLFVSGYPKSLINFRGDLIKDLIGVGFEVHVCAPFSKYDTEDIKELKKLGTEYHNIRLLQQKLSILSDIGTVFDIFKLCKKIKPDIVITYTAKPVIYTGLVTFLIRSLHHFPIITGLGYAFSGGKEAKRRLLRILLTSLYRFSLKRSKKVFFQNDDDQDFFIRKKIFVKKDSTLVIPGSGVNLKKFVKSDVPSKNIFLMVGRLLDEKGINEYLNAALLVKKERPEVIFKIAGQFDLNPGAIKKRVLRRFIRKGVVDYLGSVDNIRPILKNCKCFVLPSYREGTPRATLEALAVGRPIITTDAVGCRDTIKSNINGILVPARDTNALASAMLKIINLSETEVQKMGNESYLIAKNCYDVKHVNSFLINAITAD